MLANELESIHGRGALSYARSARDQYRAGTPTRRGWNEVVAVLEARRLTQTEESMAHTRPALRAIRVLSQRGPAAPGKDPRFESDAPGYGNAIDYMPNASSPDALRKLCQVALQADKMARVMKGSGDIDPSMLDWDRFHAEVQDALAAAGHPGFA